MEAADADRQAGLEKRLGQIDRARKLVRLHADQPDQAAPACALDHADDLLGLNPPVGLVIGVQTDIDAGAQHLAALGVLRQGVETGQRVGGDRGAQPLDRIAVVIVMRRLDHHEVEDRRHPHRQSNSTSLLLPARGRCRLATKCAICLDKSSFAYCCRLIETIGSAFSPCFERYRAHLWLKRASIPIYRAGCFIRFGFAEEPGVDVDKFDFDAPAELFPSRNRKIVNKIKYRRFDRAAEAIRFAVEELPEPLLLGAYHRNRRRAARSQGYSRALRQRGISVGQARRAKRRAFDASAQLAYSTTRSQVFGSALQRCPILGAQQVTPKKLGCRRARTKRLCASRSRSNRRKEAAMATGTVKFFNTQKGFGFITPSDGSRDVFVHISAVERAGMSTLNEGQRLTYEIVTERGKQAASNLQNA